ncbi:MAG: type II secretion system minor pseudopilin GspI [Panacagrimonas sp.]
MSSLAVRARPSSGDGFTLVEVLVAVAVLAIAMAAIISAMARQADNAGYLRQKTIAIWVAHNHLTELQLKPEWPAIGRADGKMEMSGVEWKWETMVTKAPGQDKLRRIDIKVFAPGQKKDGALAQLTSFIAGGDS